MTEPIANLSSDELGAIGRAVNGIRERTIASLEAYNGATEQSAEGVTAAEQADQAMRAVRESIAAVTTAIRDLGLEVRADRRNRFIEAIAKIDDRLVVLLNPDGTFAGLELAIAA